MSHLSLSTTRRCPSRGTSFGLSLLSALFPLLLPRTSANPWPRRGFNVRAPLLSDALPLTSRPACTTDPDGRAHTSECLHHAFHGCQVAPRTLIREGTLRGSSHSTGEEGQPHFVLVPCSRARPPPKIPSPTREGAVPAGRIFPHVHLLFALPVSVTQAILVGVPPSLFRSSRCSR